VTPRVTVLVAVKDGLPWLRGAVESVLAQTYVDFELLLVDDASTDGSAEAATAFGDPRIRVLRNERNLGQVPSLNRGLAEARGEYVARLDADDVSLPDRLEQQVRVLDADPSVALVGTWLDVVDADGRLWGKLRGSVRDRAELVAAILVDRYPWGHPSLMFRRDVVVGLGGYDASLAPAEDKDLYRRLALAGHSARSIDAPLVLYRRHEGQLSHEQAEVQRRNDWTSQERFIAELVGEERAPRLRVLLASGADRGRAESELLDALLDGAERRLGVAGHERGRLERLLARRLARRALAAGPAGRRTLAWARRRDARAAALFPLLPVAPAARTVVPVLRARAVTPLRRLARRSRALRSLYARLVSR
jgi:glycosyltransferase involved in cell wall biosynthesis